MPPFFPPSSLSLPLAHSSAPRSRYHVPAQFGAFLPAPLPALCPFHAIAHIVLRRVVTRVLVTLRRSCIVRTDISQVHWCRSVVGHHFVDDDLHILHDFVKSPRSRLQLSLDVLRHLLHRERLLRFTDRFELVLVLDHLQDHAVSLTFNSFTSLHLLPSQVWVDPNHAATSRANPPSGALGRPALRAGSFSVLQMQSASCRIDPCLVHVVNSVDRVLRYHGLLFGTLQRPHHLLPSSRQLTQYCSRSWAFRQLAVGDATRRRIRQYRHGFSHARSTTMMDEALTIVLLEPWQRSQNFNTLQQDAECTQESWSPQCD